MDRRLALDRWTMQQWADFGRRGRDVRDRLENFTSGFPATQGLRIKHVDSLINAGRQLRATIFAVEGAFLADHPEREGEVLDVIHAPDARLRDRWGPWGRRSSEPLSREEWREWGGRVRAIRADVEALGEDLRGTASEVRAKAFEKAARYLDRPGCMLAALAVQQHRFWEEARLLFGEPEGSYP